MKRVIRHPDDQRPTRKVDAAQFQSLARRVAGEPILLVCGTPVDGVPVIDPHVRPTIAMPAMTRDRRDTTVDALPLGSTVRMTQPTVMFDPRSLELDRVVVNTVLSTKGKR